MKYHKKTIVADPGFFSVDLDGLLKSKDLIALLVHRDYVTFYKQTILGPLWFIIQPLLTTIVFTIIFGKVARISTDGIPPFLFYMAGILPWMYFSSCLEKTSNTFLANTGIFGKVYFPRLVIPISIVLTNLITFFIQFVIFLGFLAYFYFYGSEVNPSILLLLTPLLILQIAMLGMGVGILISSLTIKYRDLTFVLGFGIQLWMYASPLVYPMSQVSDRWRWIISINPMSNVLETFRYMYLGKGLVTIQSCAISISTTLVLFFIGLYLFTKAERNFMDTV
jgi:lipopolysaccharide transport system permease protein